MKIRTTILVLFLSLLLPLSLFAHRVSISWISAEVKKNSVIIHAEVLPEDFIYFYGMEPDENGLIPISKFDKFLQAYSKQLLSGVLIMGKDGYPLIGKLKQIKKEYRGITKGKKIDFFELIQRPQTFIIEYPLKSPPSYLTFSQMIIDPNGSTPSVVELSVAQSGFAYEEAISLSNDGSVHIVRFDWKRKRLPFESLEDEKARFDEKRREQQLGLTHYNELYSFFYLDPYAIRMEIIIPVLLLESFMGIEREDLLHISVAEQERAIPKVVDFILNKNQIKLNGQSVKGKLLSASFYGLDFADFASVPPKENRSLVTARVGVVVSYPVKEHINSGVIHWGLFNPAIYNVGSSINFGDNSKKIHFSTYAPEFSWVNKAKQKEVSSVLLYLEKNSKKISDKELSEISNELLLAIYSSYDYPDDLQLFDALSMVVTEKAMKDLYLSVRKSISSRELGGVSARIDSIEIVSCKKESSSQKKKRIEMDVEWIANGTVAHWGHIHTRKNRYRARISIIQKKSGWKIDGLEFNLVKPISYDVKVADNPF